CSTCSCSRLPSVRTKAQRLEPGSPRISPSPPTQNGEPRVSRRRNKLPRWRYRTRKRPLPHTSQHIYRSTALRSPASHLQEEECHIQESTARAYSCRLGTHVSGSL